MLAAEMYRAGAERAREIGDRGMYNWLLGTAAAMAFSTGRDWDATLASLWEAHEGSTLSADRMRLRSLIGLLESARGIHLEELVADMTALAGASDDPDAKFTFHLCLSNAAEALGDPARAYVEAMTAADGSQSREVALGFAVRCAAAAHDPDAMRTAAAGIDEVPLSGAWTSAQRAEAAGAVAAVEGRTPAALAALSEARSTFLRIGVSYEAALVALTAAALLPDEPEVRRWADEARALFVELEAAARITALDAALAHAESPPTTITTEVEARP